MCYQESGEGVTCGIIAIGGLYKGAVSYVDITNLLPVKSEYDDTSHLN